MVTAAVLARRSVRVPAREIADSERRRCRLRL